MGSSSSKTKRPDRSEDKGDAHAKEMIHILDGTIKLQKENLVPVQNKLRRCQQIHGSLAAKARKQTELLTLDTCKCGSTLHDIAQMGELSRFKYNAPRGGSTSAAQRQWKQLETESHSLQVQKQQADEDLRTCVRTSRKLKRLLDNVGGALKMPGCETCGKPLVV